MLIEVGSHSTIQVVMNKDLLVDPAVENCKLSTVADERQDL